MGHRDTVAALIFLGGSLHFKSVEGPALSSNADLGKAGADIGVESILVHSEVAGGVAKSDEPRCNGGPGHGGKVALERWGFQIEWHHCFERRPVESRLCIASHIRPRHSRLMCANCHGLYVARAVAGWPFEF